MSSGRHYGCLEKLTLKLGPNPDNTLQATFWSTLHMFYVVAIFSFPFFVVVKMFGELFLVVKYSRDSLWSGIEHSTFGFQT